MSLLHGVGGGLGGSGDAGGALAGGGVFDHTLDGSLRFDTNDSPRLFLDPTGSPTTGTKCTISLWFKRSSLGSSQCLFTGETGSVAYDILNIGSNDKIQLTMQNPNSYGLRTDAVFRDLNAWYHLVVKCDTSVDTAADRFKMYVNGEQQTLSSVYGNYPQDHSWYWSRSGASQNIGRSEYNAQQFDGLISEFYFIDGQALYPTSFAETKDGVWVPKEPDSLTFGNNGFYLPMTQTKDAGFSTLFDTRDTSTIIHSDSSAYDIGSSDDFTIEFFFNTPDVGANYGNFMGQYATSGPHHLIAYDFSSSNRNIQWYTGNGSALQWDVSGDVTLVKNKWHHLAFQRDGTTLRAYLDGTRLTSISEAGSSTGYTLSSGKATDFNKAYDLSSISIGDPAGQGFVGYISNARYVIGATIYANDDSNITVPTATLTAVTGTKLLSCVNGTVGDDISSENNDASVTSATASTVNPFGTFNFFQDASGNNNHFSRSNLNDIDAVPDSPTNNYAIVNPLAVNTSSAWTTKNNNTKIQISANNKQIRGNFLMQSGKWYWETRRHNANNSGGQLSNGVGVSLASGYIENNPYQSATNWSYYSHTGNKYNNNSNSSYGDSWNTAGDIVGVAFDADNGAIWFSKNGTWQNSATASEIAAGTTTNAAYTGLTDSEGYVCVWWRTGGTSQVEMDINFGTNPSFNQELTGSDVGTESGDGGALFKYAPPTGFKALTTSNMPDVTITQSGDNFNTVLFTGNATARSITGVGFQADWLWFKNRPAAQHHNVFDSVRGADKLLYPNLTNDEATTTHVTSFDSDGFTIGTNTSVNGNGNGIVTWCWKAGGSASSNSDGSVSSTVSANTAAGFSIVQYEGLSSGTQTVGHGLDSAPEYIIYKNRDDTSSWVIYSEPVGTSGFLIFNSTNGKNTSDVAGTFNSTAPTNSVFTVGTNNAVGGNGETIIAYCFHSVEGYSKIGTFQGNSNSSGTFVYLGFRPAWVLIKSTSSSTNFCIFDNKRLGYNVDNNLMRIGAGSTTTEQTDDDVDFLSNGLKFRRSSTNFNNSSHTYVYLAFAEAPFKFANAR